MLHETSKIGKNEIDRKFLCVAPSQRIRESENFEVVSKMSNKNGKRGISEII
jgi:hypothetical protein